MRSEVKKQDQQLRICHLFTTFPVASETFLQRENRVLREKTKELKLFSLWGGSREFEGQCVNRFLVLEWVTVCFWLPYWLVKDASSILWFAGRLLRHPPRYGKNWAETLLGFVFALVRATRIQRHQPDLIHAAWATMPATAALMIHRFTGLPFSMGAHAYDIFQKGGDCLLSEKINHAAFIHTSTCFARDHLVERGAEKSKILWVRRGLSSFPPVNPVRDPIETIQFLTIGRLVEKKGLLEQLRIYRELRKRGILFRVDVVGDGPLRKKLLQRIADYDLEAHVTLNGTIPHGRIQEYFERADFFVFTGSVAGSGDRNGLANVIPEAMARGIPVLTTPDAGILENFKSGKELMILPIRPYGDWVQIIQDLQADPEKRQSLASAARAWVERHFSAKTNTAKLYARMLEACAPTDSKT